MNREDLSPIEQDALMAVINKHLATETAEYNLMIRELKKEGDILGMLSTMDTYVEYLGLLEEFLEHAIFGLRKKQLQLKGTSSKVKRSYIKRMYEKSEEVKSD